MKSTLQRTISTFDILDERGLFTWRYFGSLDRHLGQKYPQHPLNKNPLGNIELLDFVYMMKDSDLYRTDCITYPQATHLITRTGPEFLRLQKTVRRFTELHEPKLFEDLQTTSLLTWIKPIAPSSDVMHSHILKLDEAMAHLLQIRRQEAPITFIQSLMDAFNLPVDALRLFIAKMKFNSFFSSNF